MAPFNYRRGFTLIELLVTLALVAILMTVAAPSFVAFQRNAELTSLANTLLASINAARGEAMKRGRNAVVSPRDGAKWKSGWVVYVDVDASKTFSSNDVMVHSRGILPEYIIVTANGSADEAASAPLIKFNASGFPEVPGDNLTFNIERNDVVASQKFSETRRLTIAKTGRAKICKPVSATDENCKPGT